MFNADKPITSIDEDILGRSDFAKQLADAILQFGQTDNYAIGLYGEWGCGKTSILNMALAQIKEKTATNQINKQPIIISFNPWNFTDCKQLLSQFFVVLSNNLNFKNKSEKLKAVGDAIERYSSALEYTKYIPIVGNYLKILPGITKSIGSNIKKNAGMKLDDISNRKGEVEKALIELNTRIIIVIDDIDRLPNDQIRLIFQLVNSLAGFPNVTYLLSFDKNIATRALTEVQNCNGEEYLEKIIQVPFEVPKVNIMKIQEVLFTKLDSIITSSKYVEFDMEHWTRVFNSCIKPFIKSLRDVNRFFNTFYFQNPTMKTEVDFIDIAGITALQIFAPPISKWIYQNKIYLLGGVIPGGIVLDKVKNEKDAKIQLFKTIYPVDPECMVNAVASLFPIFSKSVGIFTEYSDNSELRQKMRIASENRFDIYFTLSLDEISISRIDFERSIFEMEMDELFIFIDNLYENESSEYYLSELQCHLSLIPIDRIEYFIRLLFYMGGRLNRKYRGIFPKNSFKECIFYIEKIFERYEDENNIFTLLKNILNDSNLITFQFFASLLKRVELSHGRLAADKPKEMQLITVEHLEVLEKIFLSKLEGFISGLSSFSLDEAVYVIQLWEHLDSQTCSNYLNKTLKDDINVVKFISTKVTQWTNLAQKNIVSYEFNKNDYVKYVSTEDVCTIINRVRMSPDFFELSSNQREIAAAFVLQQQNQGAASSEEKFKQVRKLVNQWEADFKDQLLLNI